MTNYKEILRLKGLGLNNSQIAASLSISRQTVITVHTAPQLQEHISDFIFRSGQAVRPTYDFIKSQRIWFRARRQLLQRRR